ncbi:hypothetical protein OU994_30710 [Pseudoduganella sp. SL102]|uniref:hypothetical protein n=1 Tax=Pseudoduganella sp. SL102 TaxID=2995154 RepID=UPI00248CA4E8|nr:hypothetical protein [Pseudoduganella sp. SL102]WBS02560.1 hypothetical protein OU994_30710 [Pseudoduganella sp. SL102]
MMIEALRDAYLSVEIEQDLAAAPRIGQVDQVLADGTRVCHVRYRYEVDALPPAGAASGSFDALPLRCDLVEQFNIVGQSRTQGYEHRLLARGKNTWKVIALPSVVGASGGKATNFVEIECSQGLIHGFLFVSSNTVA